MTDRQHRTVKEQFSRQAHAFDQIGLTLSNRDYLTWMVDVLGFRSHDTVLDVATGTGHLARAIAPRVRRIIALDLTPKMLDEGRLAAEREGLTNVTFVQGLAEHLPYPADTFDAVVSRFGVHHFAEPYIQVREMARVCRPGGRVALIDLVAPDDEAEALTYNFLERLRDPSHTRALSVGELQSLFEECGLTDLETISRDVEVDVERWLALTEPPPARAQELLQKLAKDVAGSTHTGMRPDVRDGTLKFTQTWVIAVGNKPR
jgi:ubiquinone/menaquinone biosynthesis C-methylase UbiE